MSHSKRNTSRAVFTSYERGLAKAAWTVSSARLTRDSFLPFASCSLCLEPAQDPVACTAGDIFCRECALSNILAQKKEMRRLERVREHEARERAERQAQDDAEAQARAVHEFEMVQAGLESKAKRTEAVREGRGTQDGRDARDDNGSRAPDGDGGDGAGDSRKRKFALDEDELRRIADADRSRARRAIEAERTAAHDARALPSFWTPSETPDQGKEGALVVAAAAAAAAPSTTTTTTTTTDNAAAPLSSSTPATTHPRCPAGRDGHTYSLHTLVTVRFATDSQGQRICPACSKTLSNASKAVLAKPCGHVLCRSCVHQFVKPPGRTGSAALFDPHAPPGTTGHVRCYVCDADLEPSADGAKTDKHGKGKAKAKDKDKKKERVQPGLVDLRSEGTGFSAGGASEVKKNATAFQC